MKPSDDAQSAAELLGPPSVPGMRWYRGRYGSGTDRVLDGEAAFCVLPGNPRPAPAGDTAEWGPW